VFFFFFFKIENDDQIHNWVDPQLGKDYRLEICRYRRLG